MDVSPTKKRKTSLTTSVAVKPQNASNQPVIMDGSYTTPRRASFMSPTKASLARFHPDLLQSPGLTTEEAQRRDGTRSPAASRKWAHRSGRPLSPAKTALVNPSAETVIPATFLDSPKDGEEREQENATEQLEHELQANAPQ
ncbi:MAG: hypothetical protein Q9187_002108, partial [Circinaria calcarea]